MSEHWLRVYRKSCDSCSFTPSDLVSPRSSSECKNKKCGTAKVLESPSAPKEDTDFTLENEEVGERWLSEHKIKPEAGHKYYVYWYQ